MLSKKCRECYNYKMIPHSKPCKIHNLDELTHSEFADIENFQHRSKSKLSKSKKQPQPKLRKKSCSHTIHTGNTGNTGNTSNIVSHDHDTKLQQEIEFLKQQNKQLLDSRKQLYDYIQLNELKQQDERIQRNVNYTLVPNGIQRGNTLDDVVNQIETSYSKTCNNDTIGENAVPESLQGYWTLDTSGKVTAYGNAKCFGSIVERTNKPAIGMAITPSREGYWIVTEDGNVFAFGDAQFYGSASGIQLSRPIVGMERTPTGNGYWLISANGGILTFGDAEFFGSSSYSNTLFKQPIIGIFA